LIIENLYRNSLEEPNTQKICALEIVLRKEKYVPDQADHLGRIQEYLARARNLAQRKDI
jgi:hypothetical protein